MTRLVSFQQVESAKAAFYQALGQYWQEHCLFSWQWWMLLCSGVALWIFWVLLADKKRLIELLLFGAFIAFFASGVDSIGWSLQWWSYPTQIIWITGTPLVAMDLAILPVGHMLTYQWFRSWKSYLVALLVFGLVGSFVVEPLFVHWGIYKLYSWRYVYSLPIYVVKAVLARLFIQWLMAIERRHRAAG